MRNNLSQLTPEMAAGREAGDQIVNRMALFAAASGTIPIPLVDAVAVAALEIHMIDELATAYKYPFPTQLALYKALISLIGSIGPIYFAARSHSLIKGVPLVGHLISAGIMSIAGAAAVYAVGKIFQMHFESGGTLLSRNSSLLKKLYREKYNEGKKVVPQLLTEQKAAP